MYGAALLRPMSAQSLCFGVGLDFPRFTLH
jgi:hypothetical protein